MSHIVCHQYDERLADAVRCGLPADVEFVALGNEPETAWKVPGNADVLLINQDSQAIGLDKTMPRPEGWPFNLRWVHLRSTGIDKYPDWIFEVPTVTVTRGGSAVPISEYVLAAMLTVAKEIAAIWIKDNSGWRNHRLSDLSGQNLGIVGFGEIGKEIARRALGFGMNVSGMRRAGGLIDFDGVAARPLEELLRQSDHLVLCAPLTEETRGMIGARELSMTKPGAHIINVGRGGLIDTEALRSALDGPLGGVTLDVTEPEPLPEGHWLLSHPKARISPHISGSSPRTRQRVSEFFWDNLERFRTGNKLNGVVSRELRY